MGNVLQLSAGREQYDPVGFCSSLDTLKETAYVTKIKELRGHKSIKVKVEDYELQLQQFWQWASAIVITDIEIAQRLHIHNSFWPYGLYVPTIRGWSRSQLGAKHFQYHNHRLTAFVYSEDMDAATRLEWNSFVNCYC